MDSVRDVEKALWEYLAPGVECICYGRSCDGQTYENLGTTYTVAEKVDGPNGVRTVRCRRNDPNEPLDVRIVEWHPMQCWPLEKL